MESIVVFFQNKSLKMQNLWFYVTITNNNNYFFLEANVANH